MGHGASALFDAVPGAGHAQPQIGVLAVSAREALVEPPNPLEHGPPVGHFRGDPERTSRPLTFRSLSEGRRPSGSGTAALPWLPATRALSFVRSSES
jgi:hypothetical protein